MATGIVLLENVVQKNVFHQNGFKQFAIFGMINVSVDDNQIFPPKVLYSPKESPFFHHILPLEVYNRDDNANLGFVSDSSWRCSIIQR